MLYDLIIIGGGPAGSAAAVYAARKQLKTLLIVKEWGGQSIVSDDIQNWIGTPHISGADLAKKYGESDEVCNAIRSHHDDEKPSTALGWIVHAANVLSNARPGARRNQMDNFINRLKDLESIANSFDGVIKAVALQAGREVHEPGRPADALFSLEVHDPTAERESPHLPPEVPADDDGLQVEEVGRLAEAESA